MHPLGIDTSDRPPDHRLKLITADTMTALVWSESRGGCNTRYALSSSSRRCLGIVQFSVVQGHSLSRSAMASKSVSDSSDRSVPLGMQCHKSPFAFSLLPHCQGECGLQKY